MAQNTLKAYILLTIFILLLTHWASAQTQPAQPSGMGSTVSTLPGPRVLLSISKLQNMKILTHFLQVARSGGLEKLKKDPLVKAFLAKNPAAALLITNLSKNGDITKLLELPEVKKLLQPGGLQKLTPSDAMKLLNDPTVKDVLKSSDVQNLLKSPALNKLVNSPAVQKLLAN